MTRSRFVLISAKIAAVGGAIFIGIAAPVLGGSVSVAADDGGTSQTPPPPPPVSPNSNPWQG